jgi:hypothetical protein
MAGGIGIVLTVSARFSEKPLNDAARQASLAPMMQAYLKSMADIGAETWLMHGTLMGWWWNRKVGGGSIVWPAVGPS